MDEGSSNDVTKKSKRKRTTEIDVDFDGGYAVGWAFGVPAVFKQAMDIRNRPYVDKERTKKLREEHGERDSSGNLRTIYRMLWTRGIPPARSFVTGDVFYEPSNLRDKEWDHALKHLTRVVQIKDAQSDDESTGYGGWVEFELTHYRKGKREASSLHRLSQADFEQFLKIGEL